MEKYKIPYVKTFEYTKIIGINNIEFGKYIIIDDFVFIYAKKRIKIGNYVHIASFSSITGGGEFIIKDFSGIGSGTRIITGTDDFKDHGFGNPTINNKFRNVKKGKIVIDKLVVIGANSVILPGVIIKEGAAIAAGSVVSQNLEGWGIYVGNRKVGERNKKKVLENYKRFLHLSEDKKAGLLFR